MNEELKASIVRHGGTHVGLAELARMVGASEHTVRKLIRTLAADGVLINLRRDGARKRDEVAARWNQLRKQERAAVAIEVRRWKGRKAPAEAGA